MSKRDKEQLEEIRKQLSQFQKSGSIPNRIRTTPLGKLFEEIIKQLDGYNKVDNPINYLYDSFTENDINGLHIDKREFVIKRLLYFVNKINELSIKKEGDKSNNLISIPLYDMKIVEELMNLIIVQGIYSIIPNNYLIPLEKRRLKNFKIPVNLSKVDYFDNDRTENETSKRILIKILDSFIKIFKTDSDLKDLILVGTGFTDVLTISIFLYLSENEDSEDKIRFFKEFINLEKFSSTYQLFSFYSILMNNCSDNDELKRFLLNRLSLLMIKKNGVESIIDLTLGLREDSDVEVSKIKYIVHILLSSKPVNMSNVDYFKNICDQIYDCLVFVNRPIMTTIVVQIVTEIYLKNHLIVIDFLFKKIWMKFNPNLRESRDEHGNENDKELLVLTDEIDLNNCFNVCLSFSRNLKSDSMFNQLFEPIIVSIWWYLIFQKNNDKDFKIVENFLVSVLTIEDSDNLIELIITNLINYSIFNNKWIFSNGENNLTIIKSISGENLNKNNKLMILKLFDEIDFNVTEFNSIIEKLNHINENKLNTILILILNKFTKNSITYGSENPFEKLVYLKLIQSIIENFRDQLKQSPISILTFIQTYLIQYSSADRKSSNLKIVNKDNGGDSDDEDSDDENEESEIESISPIFDFLTTILANTHKSTEEIQLIKSIECTIKSNIKKFPIKIQPILYNLNKTIEKSLNSKSINLTEEVDSISNENSKQFEIALKSINDPIPSIRVYGLDIITKLAVTTNQISTKYAVNLLISQLKDKEPFIYLNSIKNLTNILIFDKTQLEILLTGFFDSKKPVDEKLKIGEVLVRFIEKGGKCLDESDISEIINDCFKIIQLKDKTDDEYKLFNSSLTIISNLCVQIEFRIKPFLSEIIDCVKNILNFEKNELIRLNSLRIIHDLVLVKNGLHLIGQFGGELDILLKYIVDNDDDYFVREEAKNILYEIDELFEQEISENLKGL